LGSIWIRFSRSVFVHIKGIYQFAIKYDPDHFTPAGNGIVIPFTWFFDQLLGGRLMTENGGALPGFWRLAPFFGVIIRNLDLNGMRNPILDITCMYDNPAVGSIEIPKIQVQYEIVVGILAPETFIL
jgi:hypothetical protein